jgi:hypothetical protein
MKNQHLNPSSARLKFCLCSTTLQGAQLLKHSNLPKMFHSSTILYWASMLLPASPVIENVFDCLSDTTVCWIPLYVYLSDKMQDHGAMRWTSRDTIIPVVYMLTWSGTWSHCIALMLCASQSPDACLHTTTHSEVPEVNRLKLLMRDKDLQL